MNSATTKSGQQLVHDLEHAGRYPHPDQIREIYNRRDACEPLLFAMFEEALADDWEDEDDPRWYRFTHAANFMIAWRVEAALPTFEKLYQDNDLQDLCEWFELTPSTYGPVALPYFGRIVQSNEDGAWNYGWALSCDILVAIAQRYPETHDTVLAILRPLLPSLDIIPTLSVDDYKESWTEIAMDLAKLHDEDSKAQGLALFDADLIDTMHYGRRDYLRYYNRSTTAQEVEPEYDIVDSYESWYNTLGARQARGELPPPKPFKFPPPVRLATSRTGPKIGRNAPCPCGSGIKYKKCHGKPGSN